jgi:hypothetical protein
VPSGTPYQKEELTENKKAKRKNIIGKTWKGGRRRKWKSRRRRGGG